MPHHGVGGNGLPRLLLWLVPAAPSPPLLALIHRAMSGIAPLDPRQPAVVPGVPLPLTGTTFTLLSTYHHRDGQDLFLWLQWCDEAGFTWIYVVKVVFGRGRGRKT
jgi:hypothetical protein